MTPVLHADSPHVSAPCSGPRVPLYGRRGDVCAGGCGTVLRRTNKFDTCSACVIRGCEPCERPRDRDVRGERRFDDVPGFMEPARTPTREELDLAGDNRRRNGETKAKVIEYLRDHPDGVTRKQVAEAFGVTTQSAGFHLENLFTAGKVARKQREDSAWLYRLSDQERGGGSPPPAPAPAPPEARAASPEAERANDAAAPETDPPKGPPPFAGIDLELYTIGEVIGFIERLGGEERRRRVAAYVASRFL